MKPLLMWIFFLIYPGEGHERWSWTKFAGMIFLVVGIVFYIWLDVNHEDETKPQVTLESMLKGDDESDMIDVT